MQVRVNHFLHCIVMFCIGCNLLSFNKHLVKIINMPFFQMDLDCQLEAKHIHNNIMPQI